MQSLCDFSYHYLATVITGATTPEDLGENVGISDDDDTQRYHVDHNQEQRIVYFFSLLGVDKCGVVEHVVKVPHGSALKKLYFWMLEDAKDQSLRQGTKCRNDPG